MQVKRLEAELESKDLEMETSRLLDVSPSTFNDNINEAMGTISKLPEDVLPQEHKDMLIACTALTLAVLTRRRLEDARKEAEHLGHLCKEANHENELAAQDWAVASKL